MNAARVTEIANAVLYEGYILYPYRASALKNRQRFNFGVVVPQTCCEEGGAGERSSLHTECLVRAGELARLMVTLRFLHAMPGLRVTDPKAAQCGEVLKGVLKPAQCKLFGCECTPEHPVGALMVSSEGSCAAYYNYEDRKSVV